MRAPGPSVHRGPPAVVGRLFDVRDEIRSRGSTGSAIGLRRSKILLLGTLVYVPTTQLRWSSANVSLRSSSLPAANLGWTSLCSRISSLAVLSMPSPSMPTAPVTTPLPPSRHTCSAPRPPARSCSWRSGTPCLRHKPPFAEYHILQGRLLLHHGEQRLSHRQRAVILPA